MPELRRIAIVLRLLPATRWTRRALNGIRRFADQAPHWHCSLHPDLPDPLPGPYHGLLLDARPRGAEISRLPPPRGGIRSK